MVQAESPIPILDDKQSLEIRKQELLQQIEQAKIDRKAKRK